MTRTRWAAHAWTLLTLTLTTLGTYTTLTTTWWWSIPTYIATSTTAALASGTYLKALRAREACRPTTLTPTEQQAWELIINRYGKDTPA